jgi:NAD(P)-dependent dehydrogenase (short-subunit alcohol dehydrogenase family)
VEIRLDNRTALITGGSRGIGLALAQEFVGAGASVMISSRKEAALKEAANRIGGDVAYVAANAGNAEEARAVVKETRAVFGSIDILVNNAATNPYAGPLLELDQARAEKTVAVNQFGPLLWSRCAWNEWMADHGGVILNIASAGAMQVVEGLGYYDATKAALLSLTEQLAWELAPRVRVNAICPGLVKTDMARAIWEAEEEQLAKSRPLGRLGEPADISGMALFLASDRASWITGATVVIDGGGLCVPHRSNPLGSDL